MDNGIQGKTFSEARKPEISVKQLISIGHTAEVKLRRAVEIADVKSANGYFNIGMNAMLKLYNRARTTTPEHAAAITILKGVMALFAELRMEAEIRAREIDNEQRYRTDMYTQRW